MKVKLAFERKTDEVSAELIRLRDPGYIELDDDLLSTNLVDEYRTKNEPLPRPIQEWGDHYDFHKLTIKLNLVGRGEKGVRGVKTLTFNGSFTPGVKVDDVAPKTEWIEKNYGVDLKLGIEDVGDLLKLTPLPEIGGISTKVTFEVKWKPKSAKVISGAAGNNTRCRFERVADEYLDGEHELVVLFARPRTLKVLTLNVDASAQHDVAGAEDVVYTKMKPLNVRFKESQPITVPA